VVIWSCRVHLKPPPHRFAAAPAMLANAAALMEKAKDQAQAAASGAAAMVGSPAPGGGENGGFEVRKIHQQHTISFISASHSAWPMLWFSAWPITIAMPLFRNPPAARRRPRWRPPHGMIWWSLSRNRPSRSRVWRRKWQVSSNSPCRRVAALLFAPSCTASLPSHCTIPHGRHLVGLLTQSHASPPSIPWVETPQQAGLRCSSGY
jgi:hypothetical protein